MPIEAVIYLKRYDLKNEQRWKRDATRWRVCLSVRPSVRMRSIEWCHFQRPRLTLT